MKLSHLSSILITSCALLSAPLSWAKSAVSYNYAGIQFLSQNLDDADCSQDGLNLYGSMDINSDFFAVGSLSDVSGGKCGSSTLSAGVG